MGAALVTGGRGFVGGWLAKALLERGDTVVSFDRRRRSERPSAIGMLGIEQDLIQVEADLTDADQVARVLDEHGIDTVFHQATLRAAHCVSEPRLAMEVMADATFDLLEQCVASGVRKVVLASSASAYGAAEGGPKPHGRRSLHLDRTLHGVMKSFCEGLLRAWDMAPDGRLIDCVVWSILRTDERWESLSENDRKRIELMARAVVSRLLHEPTLRLKDTEGDRAYHYVDALRELFALEGSDAEGGERTPADVTSLDEARRKQSRSA